MMTTSRAPYGADSFSLKPTGWGRFFFDLPFLAVWLAFWLVFEVAAIALLGGICCGWPSGCRHARDSPSRDPRPD